MRRWLTSGSVMVLVLALWGGRAEAARNFTAAQTPAPNAPVTMGTTGTLTYRITNANTGGNTGERIYEVRFRVGGGGRRGGGASSTFSSATAAPAGWTRTSFSTTSVTFRANSWANAIVTGSYLDFPIVFNFRQTTADTNELLRDIRARYTNSTGGPPFTDLGSDTDSNQGGWTLKSIEITSLQITDTSGVPITALSAGSSFRLVMSVTNRSTATMTAVRSAPNNPPVATVLPSVPPGSATVGWISTVNSPNPLTLAPGASGTITYTYSTGLADSGTINFANIYARNNTGSGTSALATSPTLAIGRFTAAINVSSACLYSGQSFTVDMILTNRYPYAIDNVTPTLTVSLAGAPLTLTAGSNPTPPDGPVPASGAATFTFTWVYLVTSAANGQTFTFDGSATGTGVVGGSPVHTTPTSSSLLTKAGGYLISANQTNATSTNEEISWAFQNNGCAATNNVAIDISAGWVWGGGAEDSYARVDTGVGTSSENWTPLGPDPVTFTALTVADRLYVGGQGEYRLAFSSTPTVTVPTVYTFNVTITDATGAPAVTVPASVTLNPFNTGGLNDANGLIWQEQFR